MELHHRRATTSPTPNQHTLTFGNLIPSQPLTFTDANGALVEDRLEHGRYSPYAVFPQHRTGVGAQVYVGAAGATRIQVQVGTSTWYPRNYAGFAEITAADVRTQHRTESTMFTFALASAYERTVTASGYVTVIFRDQGGHVLGGAGLDLTGTCGAVPPGTSRCSMGTNYPLPAGTVDSRTEVYANGY